MTACYLGLGSNLGEPRKQVEKAIRELDSLPGISVVARSSLYQTAPVGPGEQDDYINAVVGIETELEASELLASLKKMETTLGRVPAIRWGSRIIDIDILLYGQEQINTAQLVVPHKEMPTRNFVLLPLQEIAPDLNIPGLGDLPSLLARCPANAIKKLA